jgi:gluconolactonase
MRKTISFTLILACGLWGYACSSSDNKTENSSSSGGTPVNTDSGGGGNSDSSVDGKDAATTVKDAATDAETGTVAVNPIEGATVKQALGDIGYIDNLQWNGTFLFYSQPYTKRIVQFKPPSAADTTEIAVPGQPLGITFDSKGGSLVFALYNEGVSTLNRIPITAGVAGTPTPLTLTFANGVPAFDSVNDIVVRKDGTMYVTDPGFQKGVTLANYIFRVQPNGAVTAAATFPGAEVNNPNGIALSPDEKSLYVSFLIGPEPAAPHVTKYVVNADGSLGAASKFVDVPGATSKPDGIAVDDNENVYVATSTGVAVYSRTGTKWGVLTTAKAATSVAFGGADRKTLYISTDGSIQQATVKVPGLLQ